jgi:pentalenene synthase
MPQDIDFYMPLPRQRSPDFERARADHLNWPRLFNLITTESAAQRHAKGSYAELASAFYPQATGEDLDLGVDLMSWFFLFDDLFDGPRGEDPVAAKGLTDAVAAALDGPLPDGSPLIARGFADVWLRSRQGMSPDWEARSTRNWRSYFSGYVEEAFSRYHNLPIDSSGEYMALRRRTIGVLPTVDLAERTQHCEVPQRVYDSPLITVMLLIAIDINLMFNDIASLEKEEARGEQNNLVFILMREHGWTKDRSIAHMQDEIRARVEQLTTLERCLPELFASYNLNPDEQQVTERYRINGVRSVIRGSYDWHRASGRYGEAFARAAGARGYLEELGSPEQAVPSAATHQQAAT